MVSWFGSERMANNVWSLPCVQERESDANFGSDSWQTGKESWERERETWESFRFRMGRWWAWTMWLNQIIFHIFLVFQPPFSVWFPRKPALPISREPSKSFHSSSLLNNSLFRVLLNADRGIRTKMHQIVVCSSSFEVSLPSMATNCGRTYPTPTPRENFIRCNITVTGPAAKT